MRSYLRRFLGRRMSRPGNVVHGSAGMPAPCGRSVSSPVPSGAPEVHSASQREAARLSQNPRCCVEVGQAGSECRLGQSGWEGLGELQAA
jgi:hypothetical protein